MIAARTGAAARVGSAAGIALPVALAAVAAAGAVVLLARPAAWTAVAVPAGLALAAVAWLRPVLAVALLLALAPICGTRPTTGPFLALAALTACAVPGWLARLAMRDRARLLERLGTPLGLALCAYAGASLLSLSSLPIYAPADIVGAATLAEAIRVLPSALAGADVTALVYPVLTVILTLHALVAALVVGVAVRRDADRPTAEAPAGSPQAGVASAALVAGGILAGLVITIALGALDRLGLFDLRLIRAVDPFTNPSGAERLQATFGHAGWFAQYVCYATPAVLAFWLWPPAGAVASTGRRILRVAAAGVLLAVSLAVIVLSYQRGGWITWAIVGAAVAAGVVRLAVAEGSRRGTEVPVRRLVAIALLVMVGAVIAGIGIVRITGGPDALGRFAFRARTITQVSDRQAHVLAGLRIGALQPILGAGSESFAMRYEEEYLRAGGHFYARGYSPVLGMYGSAHNVFAQTFAGKGAVGLVALILVVLAAAASAVRASRHADRAASSRVVAAVALGMVAAFALYGQVQEVFYIPALQLTVFAAFGLALALEPPGAPAARATARLGVVTGLLALALAAHLFHGYVMPGVLAEGYRDRQISLAGERLSAPVLGEDGQYLQWTGARAVMTVPRQATELSFDLRRPGAAPREVEVWLDARLVDRIRLDDGDWRHAVYPLRRMRILPRRLDIVVRPVASDGTGGADRGVAVRRIRWGTE